MPGPPPPPDTQQLATSAVQVGTGSDQAQRIGGTVANIAATPAGSIGTTLGQNAGFSVVGNMATDTPEVSPLSWLVTFAYQGVKQIPFIDQNRMQWFLLPFLAFVIGVAVWVLMNHGDWPLAIAKGIQNAGLMAVNSATNYKTIRPLGILGPASDPIPD